MGPRQVPMMVTTPGRCEGLGRGGVDLEVQELAALESHPRLHHVVRVTPAKQILASGETAPTIKYPGGAWGGGGQGTGVSHGGRSPEVGANGLHGGAVGEVQQ